MLYLGDHTSKESRAILTRINLLISEMLRKSGRIFFTTKMKDVNHAGTENTEAKQNGNARLLKKKYFTQRHQDAEKERRKEGKKERKTKGRSFCGLIMINNLFSKRVFHIALYNN